LGQTPRFRRQLGAPANASSRESDKYEELLVNPAVIKLVQARGDIDCGGARFVVIRYGNFFQLVIAPQGRPYICVLCFLWV
jgi:hypothetical protein